MCLAQEETGQFVSSYINKDNLYRSRNGSRISWLLFFLPGQEKERMYMFKTMKMAVKKAAGMKKAMASACGAAYMAVMSSPAAVLAAGGGGTNAVTQPLNNLKTLVVAVIGAVGVIILAKNVMEFAQAYQQQDSSTMNSALKGIVAGVIMAGISSVLTFLGF